MALVSEETRRSWCCTTRGHELSEVLEPTWERTAAFLRGLGAL